MSQAVKETTDVVTALILSAFKANEEAALREAQKSSDAEQDRVKESGGPGEISQAKRIAATDRVEISHEAKSKANAKKSANKSRKK